MVINGFSNYENSLPILIVDCGTTDLMEESQKALWYSL